jgi:hypothetical protein
MAWGFISELPFSQEQYDAVDAEIGEDPQGLILHTASPSGSGMRIVDFWESQEDYRRFEQEQLMPAMERLGIGAPTEPQPELGWFEVHNMRGPAA